MEAFGSLSGWLRAWLLWFAVTAAGAAVGLTITLATVQLVSAILPGEASVLLGSVAGGALVGFVQWVFLRPETKGVPWWVLATGLGWTAGLGIVALPGMVTDLLALQIVGAVLGGFALGFSQWLALDPEKMRRGEWLLMTATGWTAALGLSIVFMQENGSPGALGDEIIETAVSGTVGLALIGVVALAALVLVFPRFWKRTMEDLRKWW